MSGHNRNSHLDGSNGYVYPSDTMDEYIEQLLAEMPDEKSTLHDVVQNILDEPIPETMKRRLLKPLQPWKHDPHVRLLRTGRGRPSWRSLILSLVKNPWDPWGSTRMRSWTFTVPKDDKLVFRQTPWVIGSFLRGWQIDVPQGHPPWCRPQGFLRGGATTDSGQAQRSWKRSMELNFSSVSRSSFGKTTLTAMRSIQTLCCATSIRLFCRRVKSRGPSIKLSPGSKRHWRSGHREGQAGL